MDFRLVLWHRSGCSLLLSTESDIASGNVCLWLSNSRHSRRDVGWHFSGDWLVIAILGCATGDGKGAFIDALDCTVLRDW